MVISETIFIFNNYTTPELLDLLVLVLNINLQALCSTFCIPSSNSSLSIKKAYPPISFTVAEISILRSAFMSVFSLFAATPSCANEDSSIISIIFLPASLVLTQILFC